MAKKYNRIMLGRAGRFAKMCREEGYIGANFDIKKDLSSSLPENWRKFNEETIPLWLESNPGKTPLAKFLHTRSKTFSHTKGKKLTYQEALFQCH